MRRVSGKKKSAGSLFFCTFTHFDQQILTTNAPCKEKFYVGHSRDFKGQTNFFGLISCKNYPSPPSPQQLNIDRCITHLRLPRNLGFAGYARNDTSTACEVGFFFYIHALQNSRNYESIILVNFNFLLRERTDIYLFFLICYLLIVFNM